jgi:hypothetical protein
MPVGLSLDQHRDFRHHLKSLPSSVFLVMLCLKISDIGFDTQIREVICCVIRYFFDFLMKSISTRFLQSMTLQYDLRVCRDFFSVHLTSQEEYRQTNLWNSSIQREIIRVNIDNTVV